MTITVTWQGLITFGAGLGAIATIIAFVAKGVRWVDRQKEQDKDIKQVSSDHDADIKKLQDDYDRKIDELRGEVSKQIDDLRLEVAKQFASINDELSVLCYGMRACLSGLHEQGCNGPVTTGLDKLNAHLNKSAHNKEVL